MVVVGAKAQRRESNEARLDKERRPGARSIRAPGYLVPTKYCNSNSKSSRVHYLSSNTLPMISKHCASKVGHSLYVPARHGNVFLMMLVLSLNLNGNLLASSF